MDELSKDRNSANLAYAIIGTIFTIIVCLVIFVMRKRIKLVIQLFEEAGKAITNMPLLLLEPILVRTDNISTDPLLIDSICRHSFH